MDLGHIVLLLGMIGMVVYFFIVIRPQLRRAQPVPAMPQPAENAQPAPAPAQEPQAAALPSNALLLDDYYIPIDAVPRYGYGKPTHQQIHELLDQGRASYRARLESFVPLIGQMQAIPLQTSADAPLAPAWVNGFLPGLDAIGIFGMVSTVRPQLFLEIGSGNSTKFAARAKQLNSPQTRIISIDPYPRAEIDQLCDEIIRAPLEAADLEIFSQLQDGDILFFDGSHRLFQNSDVAVFFLEILPALRSGVYIHIHDILWPHDYPAEWAKRYYSEQYMLGALLLFGADKYEIVLPNRYLTWHTPDLDLFNPLWQHPDLAGIDRHGGSFWLRKR